MPSGWVARVPSRDDVAALIALTEAEQVAAKGSSSVDPDLVESNVAGTGSWTKHQAVVTDADNTILGWVSVHDRAGGRTMLEVIVAVEGISDEEADALAAALYAWVEDAGRVFAAGRELPGTQLDASAYAADERQRRWLAAAGYRQTRTWLQMSRPVSAAEAEEGALPGPREGVTIRRVAKHDNGLPVAADLQTVHRMLEESFADHFNSYRESFPEFLTRLREDPGHRWDHWWIAEVEVDGEVVPGGAVVSSILKPDASGAEGSYVDYIGVHRTARGRGVAKALLHSVIQDAAERGRNRVGLEVDDDSPTGADGLYLSMGWVTAYKTESWHRDITAEDDPAEPAAANPTETTP
ncbi:N-acetyltransferase GCN5 [Knoellia sinensis KCTC 19936]|uniref:N-acetyltransferase GCN5 n=2 Tax=Knoellia TaxID=136099 RepID=A0A0A0JEQ1_9MICO|nr:GNAT family N-acetyltransferase [Knoellia sinensis]KGN34076.1 N-acetyltransferase GCN5 [Knoellia sinensis KCTC 19936]